MQEYFFHVHNFYLISPQLRLQLAKNYTIETTVDT